MNRLITRPIFASLRSSSSPILRSFSTAPENPDYTPGEKHIHQKLVESHLSPTKLVVMDVSGGCGSMYAVEIASPRFKGVGLVKQHQMVNEILKEEVMYTMYDTLDVKDLYTVDE